MNGNGKFFASLLFIASICLFTFVGISIGDLIKFSEQNLDFQDDNTMIDFELENSEKFYLLADFESGSTGYVTFSNNDCEIYSTDLTDNTIVCSRPFFEIEQQLVLKVIDTDTNEVYLFTDMGNTEITVNNYGSIAKITLPAGHYQLKTSFSTFDGEVNFKLQNTSIISSILKIVFGSILGIGSMIGFIVLIALYRTKKNKGTGYDYYDSKISKQDHNKELFDADDPFSKYD